MVHRQFLGRKFAAAMMADTRRPLALPPLALAQFPRLLALAADLILGHFNEEWIGLHREKNASYLYQRRRFLRYTPKPSATSKYNPPRHAAQPSPLAKFRYSQKLKKTKNTTALEIRILWAVNSFIVRSKMTRERIEEGGFKTRSSYKPRIFFCVLCALCG
jgi:hypothetical protein